MRALSVKSSTHSGSDQGCFAEKRCGKIAVAAHYHAERRGISGDEEFRDWLEAEVEVERLREPHVANNNPKLSAKHRFQEKLETQLKQWDVRLEQLKAKARRATAEIRGEFKVQLEAVAGKRSVAQEKLQELREHGVWAWEDLKDSANEVWRDLSQALERAASLLK